MKCKRAEEHLPHGVCDGHVRLNNGQCVNEADLVELADAVRRAGYHYTRVMKDGTSEAKRIYEQDFNDRLEDWHTRKCWESLNNG